MVSRDSKETACFQGLWISQTGGVSRDLPAHADWSNENETPTTELRLLCKFSHPVIYQHGTPYVHPSFIENCIYQQCELLTRLVRL